MIRVNNLSFEIGEKKILNDINLNIRKGKIFGIIGPNGVGKTTLLRCLSGIYGTTTGEVLYDDEPVYDNPEVKNKIGYVADENIMPAGFTVEAIIKYNKLTYKSFDEKRFEELNQIFKIPRKKYIFQLSKGMKMRLSIMIALSIKVGYLILDEPTSGLDAILKKKLINILLDDVFENNTTIIISSHHLNEIEQICDDIAILENGVISYENSIENMKNKIKKIQVAFKENIDEKELNLNGIFKIERIGRVFTIITDEYNEEFINNLNMLNPLFIEQIDLSLEDVFIYKLDKEGTNEKVF